MVEENRAIGGIGCGWRISALTGNLGGYWWLADVA